MSEELNGFLTVADISGYTAYLNDSELDHARDTLTELLGVLIDGAGPPLTISKLEGDAVFSYGFEDGFLEGQTLVEIVEGTYVAFRRAVDLMVLNNTCRCNACANVSSLDLKFFVHHGSFLVQHLAGRDELLGPDVNLVHRLMKNTVTDDLGIDAYCLYTEAARTRLGLGEASWLRPHEEQVADFGSVTVWIQDMTPVYERAKAEEGIELGDDEILFEMEADLPVDPPVVWDYLSVPEFRNLLVGSDRQEVIDRRDGRIAPGATFQCYHGDHVVPQVVLEWEPFSKMVTRDGMMAPAKGTVLDVMRLTPTPGGTRLRRTFGRMEANRFTRIAFGIGMMKVMGRFQRSAMARFVEAVTRDWESRAASATAPAAIGPETVEGAARSSLDGNRLD